MRHTDERHAAMRDVACDRCGAVVRVAKFSPQHTSVQWNSQAAGTCTGFADRRAGCASLREAIDRAVREGRLPASLPDGGAP